MRQKLGNKFRAYCDPFRELETPYPQTAYILKLGAYVAPEEYVFGKCQRCAVDQKASFSKPVTQNVTGQVISIKF
jgi:hypothetical protein